MPDIQITEPIVFEIQTPTLPGLPTLDTPPGLGLGAPINLNFTCPLSAYCGTDNPCNWSKTLPLSISIPLPSFSFPPQFNLPIFGFRFEVPPPIFVYCPAFPNADWDDNKANLEGGSETESQVKNEELAIIDVS